MNSRDRAKRILALEYDWIGWDDSVRKEIETLIAFEIEDAKRGNDDEENPIYVTFLENRAANIRADMSPKK